jgi:hypothetical protein
MLPILKKLTKTNLNENYLKVLTTRYIKIKLWDEDTNGVSSSLAMALNQQSFEPKNPKFKENIEFMKKVLPNLENFTINLWDMQPNYRFVNFTRRTRYRSKN